MSKTTSLLRAAVVTLATLTAALAAEPPGRSAPIRLDGTGPYFRLQLPVDIYARAGRADLDDLRVRDASGQAVPFAWVGDEAETPALTSVEAPLFPLAPAPGDSSTGAPLGLAVRSDGTLALAPAARPTQPSADPARAPPAWIVDASRAAGALVQLRVAVDPAAQGVFPFTLEASDALRDWRPVAEDQFVQLRQGGATLERLSIELERVRGRYLRLRWRDAAGAPALRSVRLDVVRSAEPEAPLEWSAAVPPVDCTADRCDYLPPRGAPLQSVAVRLAMPNTLAPLHLSSVESTTASARPPPRNLLYALRHGRGARAAAAPFEEPLVDGVAYRIERPAGEIRSAPFALDGLPHARLRLRSDGAFAGFGSPAPTLAFAVRPRTLVFLARGRAPYTLGWLAPGAALPATLAPAVPLAVLMPDRRPGEPLAADSAKVTLPADTLAAALPASAATGVDRSRPVWLWAALAGAVALLGAMAWSLLRGVRQSDATGPPPT